MNDTNGNGYPPPGSSNHISGYGYGIGVSVGILLLITTVTLASYYCTRGQQQPANQRNNYNNNNNNNHQLRGENDGIIDHSNDIAIDVGLDEATIKSYRRCLYSEAEVQKKKDSTATCCSICLADYKSSDMVRVLPDCNHLFHVKCVDPWLRLHPTCPVCRTTPIPTPLSTPLAELVPLATRRD